MKKFANDKVLGKFFFEMKKDKPLGQNSKWTQKLKNFKPSE